MRTGLIGFSLFLFAELVCFHGTILFPGLLGISQELGVAIMTVSLLSKAFGYFGCFFFSLMSISKQRLLGKVGVILLVLGILIMPTIGTTEGFSGLSFTALIELIAAGTFLGVGDALLNITWGRFCAELPPRKAYLFIIGCQTAALVLYASTFILPDFAIIAAVIIALAGVAIVLVKTPNPAPAPFDPAALKTVFSELWRPIFGTSVFAFLTGVMPWISGQYDGSVDAMRALSFASSALMLLLLAIPVVIFKQNVRIENAFKLILPIVATGFLLLPIIWNGFGGIVNAFVGAGSYAAGLVLWCLAADSARKHGLSAITVFSLALGVTTLASALGKAFGYFGGRAFTEGDISITAISLVSLYLLSMIALFLFKRQKPVAKPKPAHQADSETTDRKPTNEHEEIRRATCRALAEQHDLTDREADVLMLLSQGQSVASLAEQLKISENTAKTHIKKTYRKLGVHSKQDVIDLCREQESSQSETIQ
ncbi:MAG: LuxR C-terminal-related transcriptional regulator [Raoultibacter sp.]